jgi:hypothetical protein
MKLPRRNFLHLAAGAADPCPSGYRLDPYKQRCAPIGVDMGMARAYV